MRPILSPIQCQAARVMLKWGQAELATRAGLHVQTICLFETEQSTPTKTTLEKIIKTLEAGGIEFLPNGGIQPKTTPLVSYEGTEGFRHFMDDVYEVAKEQGGEICLFNTRPSNWTKWLGAEWYEAHTTRMAKIIDNFTCQILCREGDYTFIGSKHAEYRWVPKELWNEQSFYSYGDRLGFLNFEDDSVNIVVLKQQKFAEGFRVLFNLAWDQISIIPDSSNHKPQTKSKTY